MSAAPNSAPIFSGEYRHALDEKKRITIPSRWREKDKSKEEFFLTPAREGTFLRVMPPDVFSAAAEKVKTDPGITPKEAALFLRHFYSQAQHVEMDKQGRLLLPDEYCKRLKLQGEVVLIGALETFEIWSKEAWSATQQSDEPTFGRIADRVGL